MPLVTYTNSIPGTIIDCFPIDASLVSWSTLKVRLTEGTGPNAGRWTGTLDFGDWAVFEGGTTPANFSKSVGTLYVEEAGQTLAQTSETDPDVSLTSIDNSFVLSKTVTDADGDPVQLPSCYVALTDENQKLIATLTPSIEEGTFSVTIPRSHTTKERTIYWALRATADANTKYASGLIRFDYAATE